MYFCLKNCSMKIFWPKQIISKNVLQINRKVENLNLKMEMIEKNKSWGGRRTEVPPPTPKAGHQES